MYERFTDRARNVMRLAGQEAQRFNHAYIGTEHILLGLFKEGTGVAINVLKNLEIDVRKVLGDFEKIVADGPGMLKSSQRSLLWRIFFKIGAVPLTPQSPRAKKVIEHALSEARNLKHNYVGTEHLLLGLLHEQEGVAAQVLMNLGLNLEDVHDEALRVLGHEALPKG